MMAVGAIGEGYDLVERLEVGGDDFVGVISLARQYSTVSGSL